MTALQVLDPTSLDGQDMHRWLDRAPMLPKLRRAITQARRGVGRSGVAFIGDSTTAGLGSSGAASDIRAASYPYQLASALSAIGIPTDRRSTWGDAGASASSNTLPVFDPRVTWGAGWAGTGPFSLGGAMPANNSTTNSYTFTPGGSFDTIDIYYIRNDDLATFTINVDGGATLATVNSSGAAAVLKQTVICSASSSAINIQRTGAGTNIFIVGVDAYLSTALGLAIWNMGSCDATTTNWMAASNAWDPMNAIATVAPKTVFLNLGINDRRTGIAVATYKTNMQSIITALTAVSDVALLVPVPSDVSQASLQVQIDYNNADLDLGATNGIPVISMADRFVSYTAANANGFMYDALHPSGDGYGDVASAHLPLFAA